MNLLITKYLLNKHQNILILFSKLPDLLPPQSKQKKETVAIVSSLKDVMKYL